MRNVTGRSKLAATLQKRMKDTNDYAKETNLELGNITASYGLKLDSIADTIPKSDYMVCMPAISVSAEEKEGSTVSVNTKLNLKENDRVLVAWASGEPIVIGILESV